MTGTATRNLRTLGATTVLWLLAAGISAGRTGTLLGLLPRLLQSGGKIDVLLVLLLHIAGALATLVAVFVHSRTGLLLAVLYTGYSTVVLALGAPSASLQMLTWSIGGLTFASLLVCAASPKGPAIRGRRLPAIVLALGAGVVGVVLLLILR